MIEILKDNRALLAEGLNSALIGYTNGMNIVAVYDYDKCIQALQKENKWTYEEAIEWMEYNVVNSYVGEKTPLFITIY
jgi:hypothetical protein